MDNKELKLKDCVVALNNIKKALELTNEPISKEVLISSLKNCGLPYNASYWTVFRNSGLIVNSSWGKYYFAHKEPINLKALIELHHRYTALTRQYNQTKKLKKNPVQEYSPSLESQIQDAITLLKSNGYEIYKQVISYEKI